MEKQFRFFRLTDLGVKKDGLIIYGGPQIADLENSLRAKMSYSGSSENWTRIFYHEKTRMTPDCKLEISLKTSMKAWPNTRPNSAKLHTSVNLRTKMKLSSRTKMKP